MSTETITGARAAAGTITVTLPPSAVARLAAEAATTDAAARSIRVVSDDVTPELAELAARAIAARLAADGVAWLSDTALAYQLEHVGVDRDFAASLADVLRAARIVVPEGEGVHPGSSRRSSTPGSLMSAGGGGHERLRLRRPLRVRGPGGLVRG